MHSPQYERILETNEKLKLGIFTNDENCFLRCIKLFLFSKSSNSGQLKLNIYSSNLTSVPLYSSDLISCEDITSGFLGMIAFNFNDVSLNKNINYYFEIESIGYTKTNNNNIGIVFDYSQKTYGTFNSNLLENGYKFEVFTYGK